MINDAEKFITHISTNFEKIKTKLKMLCGRNSMKFDEDALQESIIRCYTAITKKGTMNDSTPYGIESYLIRSYFNYLKEVKRSAACAKRDLNYHSDNITAVHETYLSKNETAAQKIANDLFVDFSTLYLLQTVEQNFDQEHFYLFKLKHLCNMTYKQVYEKSGVKGCRQKILEVKKWLKDNITKEEIIKMFNELFGELIN